MNTEPKLNRPIKLTGRSASQVRVAEELLADATNTTKTTITFHSLIRISDAKAAVNQEIHGIQKAKNHRFTPRQKGQLVALRSILRALEDWSW